MTQDRTAAALALLGDSARLSGAPAPAAPPVTTLPGALELSRGDVAAVSRVIEMAWEDRTPFESIALQFGLSEAAVIRLMRRSLKGRSFKLWRERVTARATKHQALAPSGMLRGHCVSQYKY